MRATLPPVFGSCFCWALACGVFALASALGAGAAWALACGVSALAAGAGAGAALGAGAGAGAALGAGGGGGVVLGAAAAEAAWLGVLLALGRGVTAHVDAGAAVLDLDVVRLGIVGLDDSVECRGTSWTSRTVAARREILACSRPECLNQLLNILVDYWLLVCFVFSNPMVGCLC